MNQKTVVITGGTSGIGFACAAYLNQHGFKVIITGRNPSKLDESLAKLGKDTEGYLVDAGNLEQIQHWVDTLQSKGHTIDGLFLNAGIFKPASLESTTEALFDETMDINFKGPFFTIQKFLPILNTPASIVLNTSIVVFKAFPNSSVYSCSKAALESLSKVLNIELAGRGIRTNIISPGITHTPILEKSGMSPQEVNALMDNLESTLPIGRRVLPSDIAPILQFLLSDESAVLRNEKIVIDGGYTL
ncbi:MAG: SDR family oxidoreductase [Bacteroidota bacterium]